MTKQMMGQLEGAGEDPFAQKEAAGGLIGALHIMMTSIHSPPDTRDTYPACISHVSHMSLWCIPYVSWLPLRIGVSCMYPRMYPACLPHVSCISDTSLSMHLRYMYLACILHVSLMYPTCILIASQDTCIPHVSRMYLAFQIQMHLRHMYPTSCILNVFLTYTCT